MSKLFRRILEEIRNPIVQFCEGPIFIECLLCQMSQGDLFVAHKATISLPIMYHMRVCPDGYVRFYEPVFGNEGERTNRQYGVAIELRNITKISEPYGKAIWEATPEKGVQTLAVIDVP